MDVDRYTLEMDAMVIDRCGIVQPDFNERKNSDLREVDLLIQCTKGGLENQ
jgi:hypothetical protein